MEPIGTGDATSIMVPVRNAERGRPGPNRRRPGAGCARPDKRPAEKRQPKAIDPDNPFAKLMALKARMEEEGRR